VDKDLEIYVSELGEELIRRVRKREPLEKIEEDIVDRASFHKKVSIIISGFNRRNRTSVNTVRCIDKTRPYVMVINLLDGNENYYRRSRIFGISCSVTNLQYFEQYSIVFDGLNSSTLKIGLEKKKTNLTSAHNSSQRLVIGLGRIFSLSARSIQEISTGSIRSIGSTTVSILEVLRNHIDIYINKTKIWNLWWALGLCHRKQLHLQDLALGKPIF
jgi:hypothetical protein